MEVVLVLAIVGGAPGIGAILHGDTLLRSEVHRERDTFVSTLLMTARARALAQLQGEPHGIYIDTVKKEYVLFRGDTYDAARPTNQIIPFQNPTATITEPDGLTTIIFAPRTGHLLTGAGTYTVSVHNHGLSVSVNAVGQIDW